MLIAAHAISGGVIGEAIGNPFIAFFVGIFLHFVLDAIPHYDTTDKNKWTVRQYLLAIVDAIIAAGIFLYLKPNLGVHSSFLWGAIGGLMPDFLDVTPFWAKQFRKTFFGKPFTKFHSFTEFKPQPSFLPGILTQVGVILIFVLIYKIFLGL